MKQETITDKYLVKLNEKIKEEGMLLNLAPLIQKNHLTLNDLRILFALYHVDGAPMSNLARWVGNSSAAGTGMIDRMQHRKLVFRAPDHNDRRATCVFITPKGEQLIELFIVK